MKIKIKKSHSLLLGSLFYSWVATATYEFMVPFGAQESSLGGAVNSSIKGASSLFFNPAGLASDDKNSKSEISVHLSPYLAKSTAAFNIPATNTLNGTALMPEGAVFGRYALTDQLGIGVGVYGAAGSAASYDAIDLSSIGSTINPQLGNQLVDMEFSIGAGYQITPEFSVGAAWRASFASSWVKSLYIPSTNTATWTTFNVDGLSASQFGGFRMGAQYKAIDDSWGVGVTFRTAVPLNLTGGTVSGTTLKTNQSITGGNDATSSTQLPLGLAIGAHYSISSQWKAMLQYDFTQYNALHSIPMTGTFNGQSFSTSTLQDWSNQSVIRIGSQFTGLLPVPIRVGYAHSNQIIPNNNASIAFVAPSAYNVVALGSGTSLTDRMQLDFAASYTFGAADGIVTSSGVGDGSYATKCYTLHASLDYRF